jgi:hypothetical protein
MSKKFLQEFDFTDADNWIPANDGVISGNLLTLTDPVSERLWTVHKWSSVPVFNGDGDCLLADGVVYLAANGGTPLELGDYCFAFWLKLSGAANSYFHTLHHRQKAVGNAHIKGTLYRPANLNNPQWRVRRTNDYLQTDHCLYAATSYGDPAWLSGNWKKVLVSFRGNRLRCFIDGILVSETCGLDLDDTDLGAVAFDTLNGDLSWTVGGGSAGGSSTPHPYVSEARSGSAALSSVGRWRLPIGFESFDTLHWVYDDSNDGDKEQTGRVTISVRIYNTRTGVWGDWVTLDSTGDMSGMSANPFDLLDVKVELNNSADVNEPFTSYPAVSKLSVIYNGWSPMPAGLFVDDAMEVLETLLTNDAELSAISGYEGAKVCQRGTWYPQLQKKAIIYICAITSTPIEMAQKTQHDQAWDWQHSIYIFPTTSEQQPDLREALMKDDVGLYKFSKLVFNALLLMDMGSTFRFTDITDVVFDPNEVQGPHDNMAMIQITARSVAEGR